MVEVHNSGRVSHAYRQCGLFGEAARQRVLEVRAEPTVGGEGMQDQKIVAIWKLSIFITFRQV